MSVMRSFHVKCWTGLSLTILTVSCFILISPRLSLSIKSPYLISPSLALSATSPYLLPYLQLTYFLNICLYLTYKMKALLKRCDFSSALSTTLLTSLSLCYLKICSTLPYLNNRLSDLILFYTPSYLALSFTWILLHCPKNVKNMNNKDRWRQILNKGFTFKI